MSPIRVTCKRQVGRGMMWKYMRERLGHFVRLASWLAMMRGVF
jgi:hypothetical protein